MRASVHNATDPRVGLGASRRLAAALREPVAFTTDSINHFLESLFERPSCGRTLAGPSALW
jgi:hypothetical protein